MFSHSTLREIVRARGLGRKQSENKINKKKITAKSAHLQYKRYFLYPLKFLTSELSFYISSYALWMLNEEFCICHNNLWLGAHAYKPGILRFYRN